MWIVEKDKKIEIISNNPEDSILESLKVRFPGFAIYRSKACVVNQFNELVFETKFTVKLCKKKITVKGEDGEEIEAEVEEYGETIVEPAGNYYLFEDSRVNVFSKTGEKILEIELEKLC